jgi:HlyD family secretion protein
MTVYGADRRLDAPRPPCHRFFIRRPWARHGPLVFHGMRRRTLLPVALVAAATISAGAYYSHRGDAGSTLTTAAVTRGSIVSVVSATGTVQPVTTVQVGSQVSGIVESLSADFNSIVRKGQVLARLDQSTFASALEQARASLGNAEAELERLRVAKTAADSALVRAQELSSRQLLPAQDLQTAMTDSRTAAAQVVGAEAKVKQAQSAVESAQVNLAKTVIVSASFSAPTIFVIAADLTKMQLNASIDESDVGQVAAGQSVSFSVDAYPAETFRGTVSQVRLDAATVNNVVTYAAIIDASNPELKLKPGMTANATIEVARREDVLRVPAAALRFKPDTAVLAQYAGGTAAPSTPAGRTLWVMTGNTIAPVTVKAGASDGTNTEIAGAPVPEGALVVTRAVSASGSSSSSSSARPATTGNPLLPSRPGGR